MSWWHADAAAPSRNRIRPSFFIRLTRSAARSSADSGSSTSDKRLSPAWFNNIRRPTRSKTVEPRSSSSALSEWLNADGVRCSTFAAEARLPSRATAQNTLRIRVSTTPDKDSREGQIENPKKPSRHRRQDTADVADGFYDARHRSLRVSLVFQCDMIGEFHGHKSFEHADNVNNSPTYLD